jgi:hypothetical protein
MVVEQEPEERHRLCWYGRRTPHLPDEVDFHATIVDGQLLYCAHPMLLPVVGFAFDVRNCIGCDYFRAQARPCSDPQQRLPKL